MQIQPLSEEVEAARAVTNHAGALEHPLRWSLEHDPGWACPALRLGCCPGLPKRPHQLDVNCLFQSPSLTHQLHHHYLHHNTISGTGLCDTRMASNWSDLTV